MKQEDKELLLKDLCARLSYGVICDVGDNKPYTLSRIEIDDNNGHLLDFIEKKDGLDMQVYLSEVKPYLFPFSSMTEAQRIKLYKVLGWGYESHYHLSKEWEDFNESIDNNGLFLPAYWVSELNKMYNWLNKNHFDYRGLIEKGLAIDATGLNIY